jgi:hypothetical protein
VLEFPQSGERFEGVTNFTEWRRKYPAEVRFRVRRITAREDLVVAEVSISYNGGPWHYGVQLMEFREDKVARERIYVMEGWEAPEWRAPWRSAIPADPPESTDDAGSAIQLRSARQSTSRRPGAGTSSHVDQRREERDAQRHASVPLLVSVLVRFVVRSFSTNSRPASGRPPAALGRQQPCWRPATSRMGNVRT